MKKNRLLSVGIIAAIGSSICCIGPVIAIFLAVPSIAGGLLWFEPLRPYLVILTVLILGYLWYNHIKSSRYEIACNCDEEGKISKFFKSRLFLVIITVFNLMIISFPYYHNYLFSQNNLQIISGKEINQSSDSNKIEVCDECKNYEVKILKK